MGVVAITFVRDDRSKSVEGVTVESPSFDKLRAGFLAKDARNGAPGSGVVDLTSKPPPSRKEREKDGAPVSGS